MIAPSFGDIFKTNAMQNGMLPITIPESDCITLAEDAAAGLEIEVDLEKEQISRVKGSSISFTTDPFRRHCLINGLDDIALTMQMAEVIESFEQRRTNTWSWLDGFGYQNGKISVKPVVERKLKTEW